MTDFLTIATGYLLGSIPFGLLLTRFAGLGDIRAIGSGNIGATNVLRTGNRALAAATLLLDGLKGFAAVLIAERLGGGMLPVWAGIAALLGHLFPVWLGFRGGKGVATAFGVLLAIAWQLGLLALATWAIMAAALRFSSLAALTAMLVATIAAPIFAGWSGGALMLAVTALVFARHHTNIRRLLAGTEPKIGQTR
jgi:glycerol-3-phosphate acyltransferase PlsY